MGGEEGRRKGRKGGGEEGREEGKGKGGCEGRKEWKDLIKDWPVIKVSSDELTCSV